MNVPQVLFEGPEEVIPRDEGVATPISTVRAQEVVAVTRRLSRVADSAQEFQVLDKEMWGYLFCSYLHKLEQSTLKRSSELREGCLLNPEQRIRLFSDRWINNAKLIA